MTGAQLAVAVVVAGAIAAVVARSVPRTRRGAAAFVLAALVALPFAVVVASPLAPEGAAQRQPLAFELMTPDPCLVRVEPRPRVRPADCRPRGAPDTTYVLDRATLRSSRGEELRLVPGRVDGYLEEASRSGRVSGWAANTAAGRPAERVLIFAEGKFLAALSPQVHRPDLARAYGLQRAKAGFRVRLRGGRAVPEQITLIAIQGGSASAIPIDCDQGDVPLAC